MQCLLNARLKTYRQHIDMTTFTTEDREDAELMKLHLQQRVMNLLTKKAALEKENAALKEQIRHLESQVYGGITK